MLYHHNHGTCGIIEMLNQRMSIPRRGINLYQDKISPQSSEFCVFVRGGIQHDMWLKAKYVWMGRGTQLFRLLPERHFYKFVVSNT